MKKCIALLIITLESIFCAYSQVIVNVDGLRYYISGTTASVAPYWFEDEDYSEIVYTCRYREKEYNIPSSITYNGYSYTVVSIEEGAFSSKIKNKTTGKDTYISSDHSTGKPLNTIVRIKLPNTITHIGAYAFYGCNFLEQCDMPNVQTIDKYAFYGNVRQKSIIAPNLKTINDNAFERNLQLVKVDFPVLQSMGNNIFCNCSSLMSVIFPESLLTMGNNIFDGCSLLREIFTYRVHHQRIGLQHH